MTITSGDTVAIELAGAKITLPAATVADLWLDRVKGPRPPGVIPKIGSRGLYGIVAGLTAGVDGGPDMIVEVLDYAPKKMNHADAKKYAESVGGQLMTRRTAPLCFGNLPDLFKKEWHWLEPQCEGGADYAWVQGFDDGSQLSGRKDCEYGVRPVRLVDPSMIR